jgi:hypothetical protein
MPTVYVRRVNLKDSLSDADVAAYWKWTLEEVVPALGIVRQRRVAVLCTFRSRRTIPPTIGVEHPKPHDLSGGEPWQNCN